jgi:hypothetical protein
MKTRRAGATRGPLSLVLSIAIVLTVTMSAARAAHLF